MASLLAKQCVFPEAASLSHDFISLNRRRTKLHTHLLFKSNCKTGTQTQSQPPSPVPTLNGFRDGCLYASGFLWTLIRVPEFLFILNYVTNDQRKCFRGEITSAQFCWLRQMYLNVPCEDTGEKVLHQRSSGEQKSPSDRRSRSV